MPCAGYGGVPSGCPFPSGRNAYRVMEPDGPRPGKWSNATARYLSGPMDAFSLPHVREAVVVAPPQTGKTEILLNCMGFAADHYPGPALMVYDQRELAQRMSTGRVRNLFRLLAPPARDAHGETG